MSDLFDWKPPPPPQKYPAAPGFKEGTTSREAAEKVKPKAREFCDRILAELWAVNPAGLTPDEMAARLGRSPFYVRPRMSEMRARGEIEPIIMHNGKPFCRSNESGMRAAVMVVTAKRRD
jgi:hypothetical protein